MGTSLEILVLLICAPLPRFEHFALRLSPPGNSWCIIAAVDQSISLLPALPSLRLLPARTAIPQAARSDSTGPGMPVHLRRQLGKSLTERASCLSPPPLCSTSQVKAEELKKKNQKRGKRKEVRIRERESVTFVLINGPFSTGEWRIIRDTDASFIIVSRQDRWCGVSSPPASRATIFALIALTWSGRFTVKRAEESIRWRKSPEGEQPRLSFNF